MNSKFLTFLFFLIAMSIGEGVWADERSEYIRAHYTKTEVRIPMRDGVHLFTSIYTPNDLRSDQSYPILLSRTPYSVGPYGPDRYKTALGPSVEFEKSGFIFAFQDVRGKYMSEGEFVDMRPHIDRKSGKQFDESSDTYDTIEWMVKELKSNGKVGQWGISYPGYYTSAGAIDSHPALVAVSPQAPIADWFFDDFHRNGAFVLPMGFNFFSGFGKPRPEPTTQGAPSIQLPTKDGYQFFLELGALGNVDKYYFHDGIPFWNDLEEHPNYDQFWKDRNLLPHLKNIKAAVLTVGGWYDTEDLYGPLSTYSAIESQNHTPNKIVMGPWYHGGWNRDEGRKLGQADFGFATAQWFRENVQFPFFEQHLKGVRGPEIPEATVFETGANRWRQFDQWPPKQATKETIYLGANGALSDEAPTDGQGADSFPSDPKKPVPYTQEITTRWARDYVTEDQRFAAWRPDVLVYRGEVLKNSLTVAGPIPVELWVSSTLSDADWIVKVIDEFPGQGPEAPRAQEAGVEAFPSGKQELVRAGVIRGRFREGFDKAVPMEPGKPVKVRLELSDICHTFTPGHRLMIQVQSTWFPFIDRNPQKFVPNIFRATEEDFQFATHTVHRSKNFSSKIELPVISW